MNQRRLIYSHGHILDSANLTRGPGLEMVETPIAEMARMQPEERYTLGTLFAAALDMHKALKAQDAYAAHFDRCGTCQDGGTCDEGQELAAKAAELTGAALSKAEGRE